MERENDGIKNLDLLYLMDVEPFDFSNPRRMNKIKAVSEYFNGRADAKRLVFKVLGSDTRKDKLDAVWVWVQTQIQRSEAVSQLDPNDFQPDVQEELKQGILTKENIKKLKKETTRRKSEAEQLVEQLKRERKENEVNKSAEFKAVANASKMLEKEAEIQKMNQISQQLEEIGTITEEVNLY